MQLILLIIPATAIPDLAMREFYVTRIIWKAQRAFINKTVTTITQRLFLLIYKKQILFNHINSCQLYYCLEMYFFYQW